MKRARTVPHKHRTAPGSAGYNVEMLLAREQVWIWYTTPKQPTTIEMAHSYAGHLRRNHTGTRIIDLATGTVVKAWDASGKELPCTTQLS